MQEKLAIHGGSKALEGPLPTWPWFDEKTLNAVLEPLRSGTVSYTHLTLPTKRIV